VIALATSHRKTSRLVALVVVLGLLAAPVAVGGEGASHGFVRSLTIPQSVLVRSDQAIQ
jgi:hypothetical protein